MRGICGLEHWKNFKVYLIRFRRRPVSRSNSLCARPFRSRTGKRRCLTLQKHRAPSLLKTPCQLFGPSLWVKTPKNANFGDLRTSQTAQNDPKTQLLSGETVRFGLTVSSIKMGHFILLHFGQKQRGNPFFRRDLEGFGRSRRYHLPVGTQPSRKCTSSGLARCEQAYQVKRTCPERKTLPAWASGA